MWETKRGIGEEREKEGEGEGKKGRRRRGGGGGKRGEDPLFFNMGWKGHPVSD